MPGPQYVNELARLVSDKMEKGLERILANCNTKKGAIIDYENVSDTDENAHHGHSMYNHDYNVSDDLNNAQHAMGTKQTRTK